MSQLLEQLNPQQREAVELTEGPMLILAGAGSGKTRVITYRIAYLIRERGVEPERILAVTFTNKAADQMKERVAALLQDPAPAQGIADSADVAGLLAAPASAPGATRPAGRRTPQISTFHSFCVRVLRRDISQLNYPSSFAIYDEDDQLRLVKAAMTELGIADRALTPRGALSRISQAKNQDWTPERMLEGADAFETKVARVYERYEQKLRQAQALDFDDLLLKTVELLDRAADVRERYNRWFRYILVDEYQDTNRVQYRLIRQLTEAHQNLCVVGDEDQSIYRWRGATIENILNFERDYPATRVIRLEQNYRSTQLILDAAGAVVKRNQARKGKTLWTERGQGQRVRLYTAATADEEGRFVAREIAHALGSSRGASLAVLYRTNAQSRILEEAMRQYGIPYRLVGGFSFYARAEIKDVLAYARLAANERDTAALLRIINTPPRGIGETTVQGLQRLAQEANLSLWEALEEMAARGVVRAASALRAFRYLMEGLRATHERLALRAFLEEILSRTEYLALLEAERTPEAEGRIENLRELLNAAAEAEERGETLADFLDRAALVSDADSFDERSPVTLMTLHSAKGLEFSTVFMVGMEEGLFPHKLAGQAQADIEEERRLCYVGMTRAKDRLTLSHAASRRFFGAEMGEWGKPSRFLEEIPEELLEREGGGRSRFAESDFRTRAPRRSKPRAQWGNVINSREGVARALEGRGLAPGARAGSNPRWKLGSRVRHAKYGVGTVIGCDGDGEDTKVTVSFPGYGTKKLVERYAALERL
jgi:ATP-dependent DNA helicase UvrD/PcrA